MRRVLCAAAVILMVLAAAGIAEEEPTYETVYVVCHPESFVYVRGRPKKTGEIIGRVECGDALLTLGKKKGPYLKVYGLPFEATEGWIHAGYVAEDEPEIYPEGEEMYVAALGRVAVRRWMNGKRRAWIYPGKYVTVFVRTEEWCLTNRGYIQSKYLE